MYRVGGGYSRNLRHANGASDHMDMDMDTEMGPSSSKRRLMKQIFEHDVISFLPYREVISKEEFTYSGFMIDDERVIGMSVSAFNFTSKFQDDFHVVIIFVPSNIFSLFSIDSSVW